MFCLKCASIICWKGLPRLPEGHAAMASQTASTARATGPLQTVARLTLSAGGGSATKAAVIGAKDGAISKTSVTNELVCFLLYSSMARTSSSVARFCASVKAWGAALCGRRILIESSQLCDHIHAILDEILTLPFSDALPYHFNPVGTIDVPFLLAKGAVARWNTFTPFQCCFFCPPL